MSAAQRALWAEWQIKDEHTAVYFGAAMAGIVGASALAHWGSRSIRDWGKHSGSFGQLVKATQAILRTLSNGTSIVSIPILPARIFLAFHYFAINAVLVFYDSPQVADLSILAKRFGWMAQLNLCLAIFLGLKNTPLSPIAGRSYERINFLHRCVAYTTILFMVLHATVYLSRLASVHALKHVMDEQAQYFGSAAGLAMIAILVTAIVPIRKRFYETFYIVHIVMVALIIIMAGLHRPDLTLKAAIIIIVAACMWVADKALRMSRWLYHGYGNHCILTPLPDEATRVTMHRHMRAQPGSHALLWIPGIRSIEKHPFTIVSSDPVDFVIKVRDGFTRDIYNAACQNPGVRYRAAIEGPYGHPPNIKSYDHVLLFAGGSGATFSLSLALAWSRVRRTPDDTSTLQFVWCVRHATALSWFHPELAELRSNPRITVRLHVSHHLGQDSSIRKRGDSTDSDISYIERQIEHAKEEKPPFQAVRPIWPSEAIIPGRPQIYGTLRPLCGSLPSYAKLLVTACGPRKMVMDVRKAVADCTFLDGPMLEAFYEEFSM